MIKGLIELKNIIVGCINMFFLWSSKINHKYKSALLVICFKILDNVLPSYWWNWFRKFLVTYFTIWDDNDLYVTACGRLCCLEWRHWRDGLWGGTDICEEHQSDWLPSKSSRSTGQRVRRSPDRMHTSPLPAPTGHTHVRLAACNKCSDN